MKIFLKVRYYKCCYDGTDISEGIYLAKGNNNKECMMYYY